MRVQPSSTNVPWRVPGNTLVLRESAMFLSRMVH